MGAIITFTASLVLLGGLFALKVLEVGRGSMFASRIRGFLDTAVVRGARWLISLIPHILLFVTRYTRKGGQHFYNVVHHIVELGVVRTNRFLEYIRGRRPHHHRSSEKEASVFLKSVSDHKNGIRNGDAH